MAYKIELPPHLKTARENDKLIDSILTHAEENDIPIFMAYEALITGILDRSYWALSELRKIDPIKYGPTDTQETQKEA